MGIRHNKVHTGDITFCLCDNNLCIGIKGIDKREDFSKDVQVDLEENSFNQFFKILTLMFPNSKVKYKEKEINCTPINNKEK